MKADGGEAVGFVGPAIRGHWGQATNQVAAITLSVIIAFWTKNVRGGNTIAMRNIRPVSPSDLELICRHRHEMFREAGRTEADLAPMAEPFRRWLAKRLEDGAYFGFVAENAGRAIGAVGLMAIDWPPHPAVVCVKFCKSDQGAWKGFFTQGVILTTATGAGETALLRRSALAGPVVNNASALFKSLEITPHFFLMRRVTA